MKNNKTPGLDGLPADFLKIFWKRLKYFVRNALNSCFKKGKLSTTLKESIITCLPKGNKDRKFLKNWRPISLLCSTYKLASLSIATRIKPQLDIIISKNQTGFLKGRSISDCTRLIYDLLFETKKQNIPGLLVSIDFEKAFDSTSWEFLYKSMMLFGFDDSIIKWIKLFNNDIQARVQQCGILSDPIPIEKGCRQGDPIAPYLFLIAEEILNILIVSNPGLKGIVIGKTEHKIVQFADDTTIILNGSLGSFQATLNILEIYGSLSGLKMNSDKTKLIWRGCKSKCKEQLNVKAKLDWDTTEFDLLGISFTMDLNNIPNLNYDRAIAKARKIIKNWNTRHLTPLRKITVIKTLIASKFTHLFLTIPTPENFLKALNKETFGFLWNNKPEKINRQDLCAEKINGGLKMVDIILFEKSLKLTWIRKIISNTNAPWLNLLLDTVGNLSRIKSLGPDWCNKILKKCNPFWNNVFNYYMEFCTLQEIKSNRDILH